MLFFFAYPFSITIRDIKQQIVIIYLLVLHVRYKEIIDQRFCQVFF